MNVEQFRDHVLSLSNELMRASEASTTETWPANRDVVLAKFDCTELNFLTLK
jgi:hypothetical protein